ncbi:uncharacterized protein LOC120011249 [Tripterygium wilfordii]|uniref:uncharacterized protein LOC120011249 n=1 Tax=Tripterygium wilfordii TaxID=458696 RepID=UPI0018F8457C|nr:uncharacterized protein LOC120011249 [Tripterygium wilfordii]
MLINSIALLSAASPLILFITFVTCISTTTPAQPLEICATFNCGQGTCKASESKIEGFYCECYPGWRSVQVGPFSWPACVLPNCSLDFKCGSLAPIPSPFPSPSPAPTPASAFPLPISDLFSPCGIMWCGDGKCLANGTGHSCQCYKGADNLFSLPELPCFRPCYLGSDCIGIGFDEPPKSPVLHPPPSPYNLPLQPPPPADYLQQPPPPTFDNNSSETSNCSKNIGGLTRIVLVVVVMVATLLMFL